MSWAIWAGVWALKLFQRPTRWNWPIELSFFLFKNRKHVLRNWRNRQKKHAAIVIFLFLLFSCFSPLLFQGDIPNGNRRWTKSRISVCKFISRGLVGKCITRFLSGVFVCVWCHSLFVGKVEWNVDAIWFEGKNQSKNQTIDNYVYQFGFSLWFFHSDLCALDTIQWSYVIFT